MYLVVLFEILLFQRSHELPTPLANTPFDLRDELVHREVFGTELWKTRVGCQGLGRRTL